MSTKDDKAHDSTPATGAVGSQLEQLVRALVGRCADCCTPNSCGSDGMCLETYIKQRIAHEVSAERARWRGAIDKFCAEAWVKAEGDKLRTVIAEAADRMEGIKGGSVSDTIAMLRRA